MNHHVQNSLYDICNTLVELNQKQNHFPSFMFLNYVDILNEVSSLTTSFASLSGVNFILPLAECITLSSLEK